MPIPQMPQISSLGAGRATRFASLLVGLATISACAAIPPSATGPDFSSPTDYQTDRSLPSGQGQWPGAEWWNSYRDPQLSALITEAMVSVPTVRIAEARLRQAQAAFEQQGSQLAPSLQANGSSQVSRQSYNLGMPVPQGWDDNGRATLDFSWSLDFWNRNRAALEASASEAEAAAVESAAARLMLSTAIASAYADLSARFAELDAAQDAVTVRTQTVTLMQERLESGLENQAPVHRALSAKATAEAELVHAQERLVLTRNALAALIGQGPDRGLSLVRPQLNIPARAQPHNLPAELIGRRADIVAARLRAEGADKRIHVARTAFYPNINLVGFYGLQSLNLTDFADAGSQFGSAGLAVSLPIFNAGRLKAQYRGAEAAFDEAVAVYDETLIKALREVADALTSREAIAQRVTLAEQAERSAEQAWRVATNRYEGGLATYLEVLSAEDALINARRQTALLDAHVFALDVALVRALGGGYQS